MAPTKKNSQYKVQVSSMGILHRVQWELKACFNVTHHVQTIVWWWFGSMCVCCMCISLSFVKAWGEWELYIYMWCNGGPKLVFVSQISLIFARAWGCFKLVWRGCDMSPRNSLFSPLCVFFGQEALEKCSLERVMFVLCWVSCWVPYMGCFKDGSKFNLRWQK
jgi:hypothetical protein